MKRNPKGKGISFTNYKTSKGFSGVVRQKREWKGFLRNRDERYRGSNKK